VIPLDNKDKIEQAKQAFLREKPALVIQRAMGSSIDEFIAWADKEFHSDRGAAFRELWTIAVPNNLELKARIEHIENELEQLKNPKKETREIKLGDGNIIKINK